VAIAIDPALRLQHALDLAYRYLGHRDRTVFEVRRHLEAKRVEPETVDEAVAELGEQGYLDDARYAQRFVEDRRRLDGWGSARIERKLLGAGVDRSLVAAALAAPAGGAGGGFDGDEPHDELAAAVAVLRRRFRVPPETDRDRDRALGVLVRKGYELELAYDAIRAFGRDG
jgi:regulatory protein